MDYCNHDDDSDQEDGNSGSHECEPLACLIFVVFCMPPYYLKSSMRQIAKIGQSHRFSMLKCTSLKKKYTTVLTNISYGHYMHVKDDKRRVEEVLNP